MSISRVETLLNADTTGSATGFAFEPARFARGADTQPVLKFNAYVAGTGAVTATVLIEATNDKTVSGSWFTLATITLSGTTTASDGFATLADWPFVRARSTAVSGTGAAITVTVGV